MIPRIFPVLRHRRSRKLYVGTLRGMTRMLIGVTRHDVTAAFASGPSYCGRRDNFELVGVAKIEFGPMPSPCVVRWCQR